MRTSLVVTPTQDTIERLRAMVSSSILTLDYSLMNVALAVTQSEIVNSDDLSAWHTNPDAVYDDCKVTDIIIDTMPSRMGTINVLVATLDSAKMRKRSSELLEHKSIDPHKWTLKYDLAMSRSAKLVINTLSDALIFREAPLSFANEMILRV